MSRVLRIGGGILLGLLLTNCKSNMKIKTLPYPIAQKDSIVEDYFGTPVADPYRWLEDDNAEQTARWVTAENEVTQNYLGKIPYRNGIKERLTELWNFPKYGVPEKHGEYYFFFENDGLQNQSVLYAQKGLDAPAEVFLDPNTLSDEGTVALVDISFSKDNRYMAYAVAASGSDWVEIRVMEVETRTQLPDVIQWVKFSGATWSKEGFYYSGYDKPTQETMLSGQNRNQRIYYHTLGTPQSSDQLIYEDPTHPLRYMSAMVSEDDQMLFLSTTEGTSGSEILYKNLTNPTAKFEVLFPGFAYDYGFVYGKNGKAIFYTNDGAPNFRLVEADLTGTSAVVRELIAQSDCLMEGASTVGGYLIASYLDKAQSLVRQFTLEGDEVRTLSLPGIGSAWGFSGKESETEVFYAFSGFIQPTTIYKYDLANGESTLYKNPKVPFQPDNFMAEQVFFNSKDGALVSMFLVHRKDLKLDGKNPLYLYGYGGFNINLTPGFSPQNILLMEQGGIYAMVNLRGGGEYGEQWHQAGMKEKKQNVFDDFISAAEYLISKGYTSKEKIAIAGGSNGGLLVGACMTQRPDLFAVAFPAVGVLDMLRFHKFTVGWGWVVEYGSSDNQEEFNYLYKYSPLHNLKADTCYPATMITTADHDDRVVPAHSFKFAATLQEVQACDKPVLIRIDTNAGHGAGKPTSKKIEEVADVLSFFFWNTDTKIQIQTHK